MRTGLRDVRKFRRMEQDYPGRNDQYKYHDIFPGKFKIILVHQVGKKVSQKEGTNGNDNIQHSKK